MGLVNNEGQTALMLAIEHEDVVVTLLKRGIASISAFDHNGRTALFYAVLMSNNTPGYLVSKGANLHLTDRFNVSVLSFVIHHCVKRKLEPNQIKDKLEIFKDNGTSRKI